MVRRLRGAGGGSRATGHASAFGVMPASELWSAKVRPRCDIPARSPANLKPSSRCRQPRRSSTRRGQGPGQHAASVDPRFRSLFSLGDDGLVFLLALARRDAVGCCTSGKTADDLGWQTLHALVETRDRDRSVCSSCGRFRAADVGADHARDVRPAAARRANREQSKGPCRSCGTRPSGPRGRSRATPAQPRLPSRRRRCVRPAEAGDRSRSHQRASR